MVVSYYSLQPPVPASKFQRYRCPKQNTAIGISLANTLGSFRHGLVRRHQPDSQTLFSSSGDQTIKLWNLSTGELLRTLFGHWIRFVRCPESGWADSRQ